MSRAELCRSLRVDALNDAKNRCSVDYINTAELTARTIVAELRPILDSRAPARSGGRAFRQRDPASRTTPFLVPWEELDDSARELDRAAVRDLPRFLADLGYAVLRVSRHAVDG